VREIAALARRIAIAFALYWQAGGRAA
jgi:hypothetical protein